MSPFLLHFWGTQKRGFNDCALPRCAREKSSRQEAVALFVGKDPHACCEPHVREYRKALRREKSPPRRRVIQSADSSAPEPKA